MRDETREQQLLQSLADSMVAFGDIVSILNEKLNEILGDDYSDLAIDEQWLEELEVE